MHDDVKKAVDDLKEEVHRGFTKLDHYDKFFLHMDKLLLHIDTRLQTLSKSEREGMDVNTEMVVFLGELSKLLSEIKFMIDTHFDKNTTIYTKVMGVIDKAFTVSGVNQEEKKKLDAQFKVYMLLNEDSSLKESHKKIVTYLLRQYDSQKREYRWVSQKEVLQQTGIGHTKYKEYFNYLLGKDLIEWKQDGRYISYRIHPKFLWNEISRVGVELEKELA